jgi:hypothetical protein
MPIFAEIDRAPGFDFNRPVPQAVAEVQYSGRQVPSEEGLRQFEFGQSLITIEGGNAQIRLRKPLMLQLEPATLRFSVKDWGIEMDCLQLPQLPREVVRKFLRLLSAAESEALTEAEQADFVRISDYIDFQEFSISRSAPRYMEGTLQRRGQTVTVQWHDGSREVIDWRVSRALSEIDPGEKFSAFVKLGKNDKTLAIERVSPLRSSAENEDWETWPKKG